MYTLTASRLSEGNAVFPTQVTISQNYMTVRVPGLFSGEEISLPYHVISSVYIDTPMIGYSTLYVVIYESQTIKIHGFNQNEVIYMRDVILNQIYR